MGCEGYHPLWFSNWTSHVFIDPIHIHKTHCTDTSHIHKVNTVLYILYHMICMHTIHNVFKRQNSFASSLHPRHSGTYKQCVLFSMRIGWFILVPILSLECPLNIVQYQIYQQEERLWLKLVPKTHLYRFFTKIWQEYDKIYPNVKFEWSFF